MTRPLALGLLMLLACGGRQAARDESMLDRIGWLEGRWTDDPDSPGISTCWQRLPGRMLQTTSIGEMVTAMQEPGACQYLSIEPVDGELVALCGRARRRVELEVHPDRVVLLDGNGFEFIRTGPDTLELPPFATLHRRTPTCTGLAPHLDPQEVTAEE